MSHGVIQAIQVLTGTHPEAHPEIRSQVQALSAVVEQLQQRLDATSRRWREQLENQTIWKLQHRLDQVEVEGEVLDLSPEVISVLKELGTTLEEGTRDQLRQVCRQLGIKINARWSQEKLRQELQSWQPVRASGDLSH